MIEKVENKESSENIENHKDLDKTDSSMKGQRDSLMRDLIDNSMIDRIEISIEGTEIMIEEKEDL